MNACKHLATALLAAAGLAALAGAVPAELDGVLADIGTAPRADKPAR